MAAVTEPSTWAMMVLGFGGLGFFGLSPQGSEKRAEFPLRLIQKRCRQKAAFGRLFLARKFAANHRLCHRAPSKSWRPVRQSGLGMSACQSYKSACTGLSDDNRLTLRYTLRVGKRHSGACTDAAAT